MLDIKKILGILEDYRVRYIVIGGTAAIAQGSVNLTFDLDICYARDKDNLENLAKALSGFHPTLRGAPKDLPFTFDVRTLENGLNFTLSTDVGDIDLLGKVQDLGYYNEVLKYSEILELYGIKCYVLTLEGLIKAKKSLARPKDLHVLTELEALLQIRNKGEKKEE